MTFQKTIFIISLLGILLLIILSQTTPKIQTGTIKSIQFSNNKITITLENKTTKLILFDLPNINLSKNDKIFFQGKQDTYKNKKQIIVKKLSCSP